MRDISPHFTHIQCLLEVMTLNHYIIIYILHITVTCYNVVHKRGWHAENANQQVTDGEIKNKQISDRAHAPAEQHNEAHHPIARHARHEDEQVGHGEDCSYTGFVQVEINIGDVGAGQKIILQHWEAGEVQVFRGGIES